MSVSRGSKSASRAAPRVIFKHSLSKRQWSFPWPPFHPLNCWPFNCKSYGNPTDRSGRLWQEGKERQPGFTFCNFINASTSRWFHQSRFVISGVISVAGARVTVFCESHPKYRKDTVFSSVHRLADIEKIRSTSDLLTCVRVNSFLQLVPRDPASSSKGHIMRERCYN